MEAIQANGYGVSFWQASEGNSFLGSKQINPLPNRYVVKRSENREFGSRALLLSASPSRRALALSKISLFVGDFLECFFGFGFLFVEERVED